MTDIFFSLKTLVAALLAYYVALRIGLERPYWSVTSCYIVAQPLTGALLSKGIFRIVGTVVGAAMAVGMVPALVDAPELLVGAMALWLGACTYVAVLDRTPRSYIALLAGYSAVIVGMSSVENPGAIFTIASLRVQEIGLGIVSVSFVHALVLPRPVWRQICDRLDQMLADAEKWSGDALASPAEPVAVLWRDRRRLATDLHDLHMLSVHLPYDMATTMLEPASLRAIERNLALLLPLASAVEDRIAVLKTTEDYTPKLHALVDDVRRWVTLGNPTDAELMIDRARRLEPALDEMLQWSQMLELSLLDRLASLIRVHATVRHMRDRLVRRGAANRVCTAEEDGAKRRALHRDHGAALRASIATTLTIILGCAFWIATAWPDGATAIVAAAIICALFSHLDAPMRAAWRVFQGTIASVAVAGVWAFAMMPRVTDFIPLSIMIAPPLLVLGWLLARPNRATFGIGAVLAFPGLVGLNATYDPDFSRFANQGIAQVSGSLLACLVLGAVRSVGADRVLRRLARATWRDLSLKTQSAREQDTSRWISRMLDRMVLLNPHALSQDDDYDRLRDVRTGMALDDLQRAGSHLDASQVQRIDLLRKRLHGQFQQAQRSGQLELAPAVPRAIDRAIGQANRLPRSDGKRSLLLALVGLRRSLSPSS